MQLVDRQQTLLAVRGQAATRIAGGSPISEASPRPSRPLCSGVAMGIPMFLMSDIADPEAFDLGRRCASLAKSLVALGHRFARPSYAARSWRSRSITSCASLM